MTSRTALITGAANRIGAAIARDLHESGMDVVVHYNQSKPAAEKLVNELNAERSNSASLVSGDLLVADNYQRIIEQAYNYKHRLDVLVNNASSFYPTPFAEATLAQWQELIGVNMQAPLFLSQQAADYLAASNGCIINLTDIHAQRPMKNHALYSTAKAGLVMLTKAMAKELGPQIRVNALSLGAMLWPQDMDQQKHEEILAKTILNRQGEMQDVTKALRFLIDDADYITGQILTIDGGRTLYS